MRAQQRNYLDQSGGMQRRTTRYMQRDNEWNLIFNGRLAKVGGITKRHGYTQLGSN